MQMIDAVTARLSGMHEPLPPGVNGAKSKLGTLWKASFATEASGDGSSYRYSHAALTRLGAEAL
jgi:hypothetical protein